MIIPEATLRLIVALAGILLIATRLPGFIYPERVKKVAAWFAGLKPGWIRFFSLVFSLIGLWILYSTLVIIFSRIPVFMVVGFVTGLALVVVGSFTIHPAWCKQMMEEVIVKRSSFFVRFICFLGLLGGVFVLLSAIFGAKWGGTGG